MPKLEIRWNLRYQLRQWRAFVVAAGRLGVAGKERLEQVKRFDMADFRPRQDWVREMKRYGILASDTKPEQGLDVYATERQYWESLWYQPAR